MRRHVLVVTEDRPLGSDGQPFIGPLEQGRDWLKWTIECLDPDQCDGWEECHDLHPFTPCDDCQFTECIEDQECDAMDTGDEREFHGETHEWRWGYGWTVQFPGCVVSENLYEADDAGDIAVTVGPGRWLVDDDWSDTDMYLILIGPASTQKESATDE